VDALFFNLLSYDDVSLGYTTSTPRTMTAMSTAACEAGDDTEPRRDEISGEEARRATASSIQYFVIGLQ